MLAVMGVLLRVVSLSFQPRSTTESRVRTFDAVVRGARTSAMSSGRAFTVAVSANNRVVEFTALANGTVVYGAEPPADSVEVPLLWEVHASRP